VLAVPTIIISYYHFSINDSFKQFRQHSVLNLSMCLDQFHTHKEYEHTYKFRRNFSFCSIKNYKLADGAKFEVMRNEFNVVELCTEVDHQIASLLLRSPHGMKTLIKERRLCHLFLFTFCNYPRASLRFLPCNHVMTPSSFLYKDLQ
jgi:hypothetical protein